jgi:Tat protein secretion system quality control protein TatD with DNase activity
VWTDSHCHLDWDGVGAPAIEAARAEGVTRMVTVGTDAATSEAAIETARANQGVWATIDCTLTTLATEWPPSPHFWRSRIR